MGLQERIQRTRNMLVSSVNESAKTYDLPSYIMEMVVADVLGELRNASKVEMLNELEKRNAESIQQKDVEE